MTAASGLGIRNNGLTIFACCVIFWCIVIPIATFGSELWIIDDRCLLLLESFQVYIVRKIQRLFTKSPKASAYFSLGWLRIECFIKIKKLLFLHSILSRDDADITKTVFTQCAGRYFEDIEYCSENQHRSTVYDLLNTVSVFGLCNEVKNMSTLEGIDIEKGMGT